MTFPRITSLPSAAFLALGLLMGCGSSGSDSARMDVRLVDGPLQGFQEINIHIQSVAIRGESGWITLGSPDGTYNLLNLTGGLSQTLVNGATLPAGSYGQMRLLLGTGNTVKLADGTIHQLDVPSGLQTGIKLTVAFQVAEGTTKDVWIDFDAARSIQLHKTGASDKYILRPTVRAYDKLVTGSVSGVFTDATSTLPLPRAVVTAQILDGTGQPAIVRSTLTNASGAYTLDLLPVGATYYVVSQPKIGTGPVVAYNAKASSALTLSDASPVRTYSAAFTSNASVGTVTGALTPMATASQNDLVSLMQSLGGQTVIVDWTMATVGTSNETYTFGSIPAGSYSVKALRTTLMPDGSTTTATSTAGTAAVTAGGTATSDLAF